MTAHWAPGNVDLPASGVTPGTYGDATHVGQVTVAASGLVTAASNVAITGGGGGGGGVLAVTQYAPALLATYTFNATALAAVDTTHLTVSFTVPASGAVLVTFSADMAGTAGVGVGLGLLNHSGGAQVGVTASSVCQATTTMISTSWYLSGLSAGTLGLDIAAGSTSGGSTVSIYAQGATGAVSGSNAAPAVLVVQAA